MEKHTVKGWIQLARPPVGVKKYEKIEFEESIKLAISAVDKQIPMKPVNYHGTDYPKWVCPRCDKDAYYSLAPGDEKYCPECGQRIDWSDVEPNGKLKEGE